MILHQPEISKVDGEVQVSARVEMGRPVAGLPRKLWFRFPADYEPYLDERSDGFAASLLLIAMHLGEDLEVRGVLSPRLLYGLREYMHIYQLWWPRKFSLIDIKWDKLSAPNPQVVPEAVALSFSGGVDSFYTLWSHLPQNQPIPHHSATHGIFIQGFDPPLRDDENYRQTYRIYAEMFERIGLQLIPARMNTREFWTGRIEGLITHGSTLLGVPLVLGHLLRRFYIAASHPYAAIEPWGTSPLSDHWLSTETLQIVHHGSDANRVEKLAVLSAWQEAHGHLRVCSRERDARGVQNCSRCEKCIRTMTMLELLGTLPHFTTFRQSLTHLEIARMWRKYQAGATYGPQIVNLAVSRGRLDVIPFIWLVMALGWIRYILLRILPDWIQEPIKKALEQRV